MRRFLMIGFLFMVSHSEAAEYPKKFEKPKFYFDQVPPALGRAGVSTFQLSTPASKSKKKAFFLSLLIPGSGELYLRDWKYRDWSSGRYFFAGEFLMWAGHFYFHSHSRWLESDSRALAGQYAGVDLNASKPPRYYINLGQFADIYSYNQTQRRLTGTSNEYAETPETYWKWDNAVYQSKYARLRASGRTSDRYAQYFYYGIFVNHLLSAINTARVFKDIQKMSGIHFHFDVMRNVVDWRTRDVEIRVGLSKNL